MLATWRPATKPVAATPLTLYLLDAAGGRYAITTLSLQVPRSDDPGPRLVDWSGDGRHALFADQALCPMSFVEQRWRCNDPNAAERHTTITDVDLATGAKRTFTVDHWVDGAYGRPTGQGILLSSVYPDDGPLERVDLSGNDQLIFFKDLSRSYLAAADGTQLLFGAANGMVAAGDDGAVRRKLPLPVPVTGCQPVRWWTKTVALA
jgi:TolB protein